VIPTAPAEEIVPPVEVITPPQIPTSEPPKITSIPDTEPPAAPFNQSNWSLFNLILTIITGAIMIALIAIWLSNRKRDEDNAVNWKPAFRVVSIAATAVAVVIFFLTEDLTQPMIMIDNYTIYHALIAAVQVVTAVISRKSTKQVQTAKQA
jgi:hypothetical protein